MLLFFFPWPLATFFFSFFSFAWPLAISLFFHLRLSAFFFFLTCNMLFTICNNTILMNYASICYGCMFTNWSRWKKRKWWPKEVKQRIFLLAKCLGQKGLEMNAPIIFNYAMQCDFKPELRQVLGGNRAIGPLLIGWRLTHFNGLLILVTFP